MVRLPARLTAKLAKVRIAQIFNSAPGSLVHGVDPADVLRGGAEAPVSREKLHELIANPSPVIWIGGREPLRHAGIGHFVRAITQSGHFVFLETDGTQLRRRIHEFQPAPQCFLTVRLDSPHAPEFALAAEGQRAARLSGFFTVLRSVVHEDSELATLAALRTFIAEKDVDGWLITAASGAEASLRKAEEARGLIPGSFWRQLSEHVEEALRSQTQPSEPRLAPASVEERSPAEAREEGMGIA